ncbi:MAG: hypothetical protein GY722_26020 [bacterium]|nr:hypothetical protein [bacterium]
MTNSTKRIGFGVVAAVAVATAMVVALYGSFSGADGLRPESGGQRRAQVEPTLQAPARSAIRVDDDDDEPATRSVAGSSERDCIALCFADGEQFNECIDGCLKGKELSVVLFAELVCARPGTAQVAALLRVALTQWSREDLLRDLSKSFDACPHWRTGEDLFRAMKLVADSHPRLIDDLVAELDGAALFGELGLFPIHLASCVLRLDGSNHGLITTLEMGARGEFGGPYEAMDLAFLVATEHLGNDRGELQFVTEMLSSTYYGEGAKTSPIGGGIAHFLVSGGIDLADGGADEVMPVLHQLLHDRRFQLSAAVQIASETNGGAPPLGFPAEQWLLIQARIDHLLEEEGI